MLRIRAAILVSSLLLAPAALQAQACQGSPVDRGSAIGVASVSFTEDVTSFGPTIGGNFEGPIFASVGYAYSDFDGTSENGNTIGGMVGAELLTEAGASFCLDAGAAHTWVTGFDIDGQSYRGDVSVGYSAGDGEVYVTPHGSVGVTHVTANVGAFQGSDTAARIAGGVSVGSRTVFLGGSVSYSTFDDADPVFGLGLGFAF